MYTHTHSHKHNIISFSLSLSHTHTHTHTHTSPPHTNLSVSAQTMHSLSRGKMFQITRLQVPSSCWFAISLYPYLHFSMFQYLFHIYSKPSHVYGKGSVCVCGVFLHVQWVYAGECTTKLETLLGIKFGVFCIKKKGY